MVPRPLGFFLHLAKVDKFQVSEDLFSDFSAQRCIAQATANPLESTGRDRTDLVRQDDGVYGVPGSARRQKDLERMG